MNDDERWMGMAIEEARVAADRGDVPIGAVLVGPDDQMVASNHNRREELRDPTAHAEILVLSEGARRQGNWRLAGHTLYVTLEPCAMCAGAAVLARLAAVVYGATDLKAGAAWSLYNIPQDARLNHRCELRAGVLSDDCAAILTEFFDARR
ncbi:MAG TPA: tRNA adenosine(34) deaminase TadA [Acidimicrobiia bacterium]|nr:tRNA adenosine(34) deaminase TadA [Acidimicrobiia bacterium]